MSGGLEGASEHAGLGRKRRLHLSLFEVSLVFEGTGPSSPEVAGLSSKNVVGNGLSCLGLRRFSSFASPPGLAVAPQPISPALVYF